MVEMVVMVVIAVVDGHGGIVASRHSERERESVWLAVRCSLFVVCCLLFVVGRCVEDFALLWMERCFICWAAAHRPVGCWHCAVLHRGRFPSASICFYL